MASWIRYGKMVAERKITVLLPWLLLSLLSLTACKPDASSPATVAHAENEGQQAHPAHVSAAAPRFGAELAGLPPIALQQRYACSGDATACDQNVVAARPPDEAEWLLERGYPAPDQMQAARSFSTDQLKRAAEDSKHPVDQSLYIQALLREGRHREALAEAMEGYVGAGNLYALHLASDIYLKSEALKNLPESMAYYRLAAVSGDRKAEADMALRYPWASPPEIAYADQRATHLKQQMRPDGQWPRP